MFLSFSANIHAPQFNQSVYTWNVYANRKDNFTFINANDKDSMFCKDVSVESCPCARVLYSMSSDDMGHFSINPYTGVIHYDGKDLDMIVPVHIIVTARNQYPDVYEREHETSVNVEVIYIKPPDDPHSYENGLHSRDKRNADSQHHISKRVS